MENLISVEMVEKNKGLLERKIFTKKQLSILKKKLENKVLDTNEKTYYYKYIKPRVKAMLEFFGIKETVKGKPIPERAEESKKIIRKLEKKHKNKKIMVSGSFLFSKKYKDIDAFIISKYKKEDYRKGKLHVTFLPESALETLFFSSLSKISVSNFKHEEKSDFDVSIEDLLKSYELLVNSIINKESHEKELREFMLKAEYVSSKTILDPKQLYDVKEKLKGKAKALSSILVSALVTSYKEKILKEKLEKQIKSYKELLKEYKSSENIPLYIDTYSKVVSIAS